MEWDAPETPLAPEGMHTGTLTFKHVDGCFYEGELTAKDPKGAAYTTKIQMMYDPAAKYLTWIETDSRGYTLFKPGTIGADLGRLLHALLRDAGIQGVEERAGRCTSRAARFSRRPRISASGARCRSTASRT